MVFSSFEVHSCLAQIAQTEASEVIWNDDLNKECNKQVISIFHERWQIMTVSSGVISINVRILGYQGDKCE